MSERSPKNTFDAVLASVPLNRSAAQVVARGEHWVPENPLPPGMQHWKSPPPMWVFQPMAGQSDLTGKKFGKFTVVGVLGVDGGKNRGLRWVCRCQCGDYEARSSKAIILRLSGLDGSGENQVGYQCWFCAQWETAKARYKKNGSRPLSNFTQPKTKIIEARTPQTIIAEQLFVVGLRENLEPAAERLIAELNRRGYRIVRETLQSNADDEGALE